MEEERDISVVPAPWTLTGVSYVLLAWFPREFVLKKGFVPESMKDSFLGGPGWVMYVDYSSSNAGPYQELLFIPGRFDFVEASFHHQDRLYNGEVAGGKASCDPRACLLRENERGRREAGVFQEGRDVRRSVPQLPALSRHDIPDAFFVADQAQTGREALLTTPEVGRPHGKTVESRINPKYSRQSRRTFPGVKMPRCDRISAG